MKLAINCKDSQKNASFSYELTISDKVIVASCGLLALASLALLANKK